MFYYPFYEQEWFKAVYKNVDRKCIKGYEDAFTRDFFVGVYSFKDKEQSQLIKICSPALNIKDVNERLNDDRFCNKCLYYMAHDFNCQLGGWVLKE
jgi:hypothetical protein